VYKRAGETMDQFVDRIKKEHSIKKLGYTARLDPMAKGIVPFVTNDLCSDIKDHFGSSKTYQVKLIMGVQTDSDDPLGIMTCAQNVDKDICSTTCESIINYLNSINGTTFKQKFHHYSTKMMNHRRQKSINVVNDHEVTIFDYEILGQGVFDYVSWREKIIKSIESIDPTKNFRQEATIKQWQDFKVEKLFYVKLKIKVSSGFFIRQLIRDMSDDIRVPLMCYNINRVLIN